MARSGAEMWGARRAGCAPTSVAGGFVCVGGELFAAAGLRVWVRAKVSLSLWFAVCLGGESGVSGFAGVCEGAGEGWGVEANSRGSGSGVGDCGGGAAGGARPESQG